MGTRFVMIEERFLDHYSYLAVQEVSLTEAGLPDDTEILGYWRDEQRNRCFKVRLRSSQWHGHDFKPVEFPPTTAELVGWLAPATFDCETHYYKKWQPFFVEPGGAA